MTNRLLCGFVRIGFLKTFYLFIYFFSLFPFRFTSDVEIERYFLFPNVYIYIEIPLKTFAILS